MPEAHSRLSATMASANLGLPAGSALEFFNDPSRMKGVKEKREAHSAAIRSRSTRESSAKLEARLDERPAHALTGGLSHVPSPPRPTIVRR